MTCEIMQYFGNGIICPPPSILSPQTKGHLCDANGLFVILLHRPGDDGPNAQVPRSERPRGEDHKPPSNTVGIGDGGEKERANRSVEHEENCAMRERDLRSKIEKLWARIKSPRWTHGKSIKEFESAFLGVGIAY